MQTRGVGWVQALIWGLVLAGATGWTSVWHLSCREKGEPAVVHEWNTRIVNVGEEMARRSRGDLFVTAVADKADNAGAKYRLGLVAGCEVHVRKVILEVETPSDLTTLALVRCGSYTSGGTPGVIVNLNGRTSAGKTPLSVAKVTTTTGDLTLVGPETLYTIGGATAAVGHASVELEFEPAEFVLAKGQVLAVKVGVSANLAMTAAIFFEEA